MIIVVCFLIGTFLCCYTRYWCRYSDSSCCCRPSPVSPLLLHSWLFSLYWYVYGSYNFPSPLFFLILPSLETPSFPCIFGCCCISVVVAVVPFALSALLLLAVPIIVRMVVLNSLMDIVVVVFCSLFVGLLPMLSFLLELLLVLPSLLLHICSC